MRKPPSANRRFLRKFYFSGAADEPTSAISTCIIAQNIKNANKFRGRGRLNLGETVQLYIILHVCIYADCIKLKIDCLKNDT